MMLAPDLSNHSALILRAMLGTLNSTPLTGAAKVLRAAIVRELAGR